MPEDNRFKFSNFDQVFGALHSVHRVKRGCFETLIVPGVMLFLVLFGAAMYFGSEDVWTIPLCVAPPVLMFGAVVWQIVSTRNDELRIYENGFTCKSGKKIQSCLWTEIEISHRRERNAREIGELEDGVFPLGSVEKKNGEVIDFNFDLPGTPEITERFESRKTKSKHKKSGLNKK